MSRTPAAVAAFLVTSGVALLAGSAPAGPDPLNVVLIGWDGAGRESVEELLADGRLANLERLSSKGALVAVDVMRTTDTKAGWAQILTGYEPERTGVFSNTRYEPIPEGFSVFERLERFFGPQKIFTAAVISKGKNMDVDAPVWVPVADLEKKGKKVDPDDVEVRDGVPAVQVAGGPYYRTREGADVFETKLVTDEAVGNRTLQLIEQNRDRRFFVFAHFGQIDRKGHMFGQDSPAYASAIEKADAWLGRIMDGIASLGLAGRTLIYVTADHGFDEGGVKHYDAPYVWLATDDPQVMRRGERADVAPTIMSRFGMDLEKIQPPLDGRPLTEPWTKPLF